MTTPHTSKSAAMRARLNHPVIDSDGHMVEFEPALFDYLKQVGGSEFVERYKAEWNSINAGSWGSLFSWYRLSPAERRERRATRSIWWGVPAKNTLDLATAMLPRLLYERMEEIGLDFAVLYPSMGLVPLQLQDAELRRVGCRAVNTCNADLFRECADRMTPVALIPMHTPQEAIEELEYAVKVQLYHNFLHVFNRKTTPEAMYSQTGHVLYPNGHTRKAAGVRRMATCDCTIRPGDSGRDAHPRRRSAKRR